MTTYLLQLPFDSCNSRFDSKKVYNSNVLVQIPLLKLQQVVPRNIAAKLLRKEFFARKICPKSTRA